MNAAHNIPSAGGRDNGDTFPLVGLIVLSCAIFVSMTTEFIVSGLIPYIATDFGRPVGVSGSW